MHDMLRWAMYNESVLFLAVLCSCVSLPLLLWGLFGDRSKGRTRCPNCWYDMRARTSLICPECGHDAREESELHRDHRRWSVVVMALIVGVLSVYRIGALFFAISAIPLGITGWAIFSRELRRPGRRVLRWLAMLPGVAVILLWVFLLWARHDRRQDLAAYQRMHAGRFSVDIRPRWRPIIPEPLARSVPSPIQNWLYRTSHIIFESGLSATGEHLARLQDLKYLESLVIGSELISTEDLGHLRNLPNLRGLSFSDWEGDARPALPHIRQLNRLIYLEFNYRTRLTDSDLAELAALKELEELSFHGENVTAEGLGHLAQFPKLQHLELGGLNLEAGMKDSLSKLAQLRTLRVVHCKGEAWVLAEITSGLPALQQLTIVDQPRCVDAIIEQFRKANSRLTITTEIGIEEVFYNYGLARKRP